MVYVVYIRRSGRIIYTGRNVRSNQIFCFIIGCFFYYWLRCNVFLSSNVISDWYVHNNIQFRHLYFTFAINVCQYTIPDIILIVTNSSDIISFENVYQTLEYCYSSSSFVFTKSINKSFHNQQDCIDQDQSKKYIRPF